MHLSQLKGTLMNDQLNSLLRAAEQQQILVDSVIDLKRNVQMGGLDTPELNEQIKIEYMKLIDIYADFVRKTTILILLLYYKNVYITVL